MQCFSAALPTLGLSPLQTTRNGRYDAGNIRHKYGVYDLLLRQEDGPVHSVQSRDDLQRLCREVRIKLLRYYKHMGYYQEPYPRATSQFYEYPQMVQNSYPAMESSWSGGGMLSTGLLGSVMGAVVSLVKIFIIVRVYQYTVALWEEWPLKISLSELTNPFLWPTVLARFADVEGIVDSAFIAIKIVAMMLIMSIVSILVRNDFSITESMFELPFVAFSVLNPVKLAFTFVTSV
jgi:hypothetical protein